MSATTETTASFGDHPWMSKIPFNLKVIKFTPRWRAVTQLVISILFIASIYTMYQNTEAIIAGVGSTGLKMPANASPPSWAFLVFPLLAIIPAIYSFLFLKYNFLK